MTADRDDLAAILAEDLWLELYGGLRNAIKALADQWEQRGNKREDLGWDLCAEELRALLHSEGEYDDLLGRGEYAEPSREELVRQRDAARAELAAANARYERLHDVADSTDRALTVAKERVAELEASTPVSAELVSDSDTDEQIQRWRSQLEATEVEVMELRATLDRVTAVAEHWADCGIGSCSDSLAALFAALTPEGKP